MGGRRAGGRAGGAGRERQIPPHYRWSTPRVNPGGRPDQVQAKLAVPSPVMGPPICVAQCK